MSFHKRIISSVLIIFFSAYSFLSLFSFNILEVTANSYSISTVHKTNLGGRIGSTLAEYLLNVFGISSFLLMLFILFSGMLLIFNAPKKIRPLAGMLIFFLASNMLLSWIFRNISYNDFPASGGGLVGSGLLYYNGKFFGTVGTAIILAVLFIISFYIIFRKKGIRFLKERVIGIYSAISENLRDLKELDFSKIIHKIKFFFSSMSLYFDKKRGFQKRRKTFVENKELFGGTREELIKELDERESKLADPATGKTPAKPKNISFDFTGDRETKLPPISLLDSNTEKDSVKPDRASLLANATLIEKKLMDFGVKGKVTGVNAGPIITMYEFEPASGIKIGKIIPLSEDLTMALKSRPVRITGVVEGKSSVGIEVPNNKRETVYFPEILRSREFAQSDSPLTMILGKNTSGENFIFDLKRCPHLLVAGATGSGKSVFINALIASILFKASYEEVNFLMIDPKRLELTPFENLPHLASDVIYDPKKASVALRWAVSEMERRYRIMQEVSVKTIEQFNDKAKRRDLKSIPYLVVIIDELSDLMLTSPKDIETSIVRLSQMARACGIHLVIATQRPSVNVVTGIIKANMPSRIAFLVSSKVDSRTILDSNGAEELLGYGDMLFMPPGQGRLIRIHGSYITENEIKRVVKFIEEKNFPVQKNESLVKEFDNSLNSDRIFTKDFEDSDDEIYREVLNLVESMEGDSTISISYIQRRFRIGFNRAARIVEKLQEEGILQKKGKKGQL